MGYFPMMVDIGDQAVLVIGGGDEGLKKIRILRLFGAYVSLIDTNARKEAIEECDEYIEGPFSDVKMDEKDYVMVVASTDDRDFNRHISDLAKERRIPVNVVDDVELCTFIFPAIYQKKDVVVAVSSGGKSPYIAQFLRDRISDVLPDDIGEINDKMGEFRKLAKERFADGSQRRKFLKEKLNEMIDE